MQAFTCNQAPAPTACQTIAPSAALLAANYAIQDDGTHTCTPGLRQVHAPLGEICYGDWYLPSKVELNLLYNAFLNAPSTYAMTQMTYWSSTEYDSNNAWGSDFRNSVEVYWDGKSYVLPVRAIRAF